jgi:protein-tyrosine phosphatase
MIVRLKIFLGNFSLESRCFEEAFRIIEEGLNNGNVYIHCFAGVSRSASIVISYLMKKFNWAFYEAFQFTKKKRRFIDPNPGFVRQLKNY